jgi:hypothetical protein
LENVAALITTIIGTKTNIAISEKNMAAAAVITKFLAR